MGKAFFQLNNYNGTDNVNFKDIQQVFVALPGESHLSEVVRNYNGNAGCYEFVYRFENMYFADGTEIVVKYKSTVVGPYMLDTFDGVDIIQPKQNAVATPRQNVATPQYPAQGNNGTMPISTGTNTIFTLPPTAPLGTVFTISPGSQPTWRPLDPNDVPITIKIPGGSGSTKCECGAEKAGSNHHSGWCPKHV
jgi:hypothetical protein